jgi:hypothetical protein
MEDYLVSSSGEHVRHIRWVCNSNHQPGIQKVVLPAGADDTFDKMISALQEAGYKRKSRRYLVWFDRTTVECRGIGTRWEDDSPGKGNLNNAQHPAYGRIDLSGTETEAKRSCGDKYWPGGWTEIHELWHTLGAVQKTAPHSDHRQNPKMSGHCFDEWDLMCYDNDGENGPVEMKYLCGNKSDGDAFDGNVRDKRLDCGKDDYFNTDPTLPPKGTYLADKYEYENGSCNKDSNGDTTECHWNTAWSRFLIK